MPKTPSSPFFPPLDWASAPGASKQKKLYEAMKTAILEGQLPVGTQLPPSRRFAAVLKVSRTTVTEALAQLSAEGYVEGKVGAGTFVREVLPFQRPWRASPKPGPGEVPRLSSRGQLISKTPASRSPEGVSGAFRPGVPALEHFPVETWARFAAASWRAVSPKNLGYPEPAGHLPLREEVAAYVEAARGVRCHPEQVLMVTGSQQALYLAALVLLNPGELAGVEDPGYVGARGAFLAAGVGVEPIPVDADGIDVRFAAGVSGLRLIHVTPSHEYPLGMTMPLARRLELLEWAHSRDVVIVEDDYDSEYRYSGHPVQALQGLDIYGRVIYVGSVSKVLAPALRMGYMVVPEALVAVFGRARALLDRGGPLVPQMALARFIREGHLARHIRITRDVYAARQATLVAAAAELRPWLEVLPQASGMTVIGWLPPGVSDREISERARHYGIIAPPLSAFATRSLPRGGLLLGYTGVSPAQIREGVDRLALVRHELENAVSPPLAEWTAEDRPPRHQDVAPSPGTTPTRCDSNRQSGGTPP